MLKSGLGNFFKSKVKGLIEKSRSPSLDKERENEIKVKTPKLEQTESPKTLKVQSLPRLSLKKD